MHKNYEPMAVNHIHKVLLHSEISEIDLKINILTIKQIKNWCQNGVRSFLDKALG